MKLYFFGKCFDNDEVPGRGIISIMMPDLGIIYRTQFQGTQSECEYTAAIMAVKFVDNNKEFLGKQKIEVISDCVEMIEQVNGEIPGEGSTKIYRDTINMYLKKYGMTLAWIPRAENRAAQIVPRIPPLKLKLNLEFDFGQQGNDAALFQMKSSDKPL